MTPKQSFKPLNATLILGSAWGELDLAIARLWFLSFKFHRVNLLDKWADQTVYFRVFFHFRGFFVDWVNYFHFSSFQQYLFWNVSMIVRSLWELCSAPFSFRAFNSIWQNFSCLADSAWGLVFVKWSVKSYYNYKNVVILNINITANILQLSIVVNVKFCQKLVLFLKRWFWIQTIAVVI